MTLHEWQAFTAKVHVKVQVPHSPRFPATTPRSAPPPKLTSQHRKVTHPLLLENPKPKMRSSAPLLAKVHVLGYHTPTARVIGVLDAHAFGSLGSGVLGEGEGVVRGELAVW